MVINLQTLKGTVIEVFLKFATCCCKHDRLSAKLKIVLNEKIMFKSSMNMTKIKDFLGFYKGSTHQTVITKSD